MRWSALRHRHTGGGVRRAGRADGGTVTEHLLSTLGLALRAGAVAVGEEPVGAAARAKKARVIFTARDAAASSVRRAYSFGRAGSCLCLPFPADKETFGRALGRTSVAMCAVTDIGFAQSLVKKAGGGGAGDLRRGGGGAGPEAPNGQGNGRKSNYSTRRTCGRVGTAFTAASRRNRPTRLRSLRHRSTGPRAGTPASAAAGVSGGTPRPGL